jgi:hypothetical protein
MPFLAGGATTIDEEPEIKRAFPWAHTEEVVPVMSTMAYR